MQSPLAIEVASAAMKRFTFGLEGKTLVVNIPELVDPSYGMYVWPSAPVLAQYIWHHMGHMKDKKVLELGAGTALPGVVAAKVGAHVTLSDAAHLPLCLENCRKSLSANQLPDTKVIKVTWGQFEPDLLELEPQDIVLGSDCFYDTKDFEDTVATVRYLLDQNAQCQFWTTYQERSSSRCIDHLLLKWGLQCREIPLSDFGADSPSLAGSDLPGRHSIQMLVITRDDT